ncbi:MAG: hypothetical protein KGI04_00535 [Candidatus Micrarchaeota archaeon]|nr:hypothetical protein [Candidatus Micrarchaeota archaeon]
MRSASIGVLRGIPLKGIRRIDAALEGNWNSTVTPIWDRKSGTSGFSKVIKWHKKYKPSIELYFDDYWIGLHCYKKKEGKNVFDEKLALKVIDYVNRQLSKGK